MKFINYVFSALLLICCEAQAMDASSYNFLLKESKSGNKSVQMMLDGYFIGVSESLGSLHALNRGRFHVGNGKFACPASADSLTPEMAITALQQVIGTEYHPKVIENGLDKAPVAGLVIIGLGKLFPCE